MWLECWKNDKQMQTACSIKLQKRPQKDDKSLICPLCLKCPLFLSKLCNTGVKSFAQLSHLDIKYKSLNFRLKHETFSSETDIKETFFSCISRSSWNSLLKRWPHWLRNRPQNKVYRSIAANYQFESSKIVSLDKFTRTWSSKTSNCRQVIGKSTDDSLVLPARSYYCISSIESLSPISAKTDRQKLMGQLERFFQRLSNGEESKRKHQRKEEANQRRMERKKGRTHRTLRGNRGTFHGKGDAVESDEEEHWIIEPALSNNVLAKFSESGKREWMTAFWFRLIIPYKYA